MDSIKDRIFKKSAQQRLPLTGAFELSPVCNFSCKMCYVRKSMAEVNEEGGLMPPSFWLDMAEQARSGGTLFPLLTGGEVFVYPHFREIYEEMNRMGMQISINSNGSLITEDTVQWLRQIPPQRINITLYGASDESYERLCGDPHGFTRVCKGLSLLEENHIRYKLNCSVTPYNKDDLPAMIEFAENRKMKLKIATYMFPPVRRTGISGDYGDRLSPQEAAYAQVYTDWKQLEPMQFAALAHNAMKYRELTPELITEAAAGAPRNMHCLAGRCSYWIDWQGNLSGCGMADYPKVSLRDKSFVQAWKEITDWTEQARYSSICGNCVNRELCYTCMAMVRNETGDLMGRPEYICEMRKYEAQYYRQFADKLPKELQVTAQNPDIPQFDPCGIDDP